MKRVFTIFLAAALSLSLAACGGTSEGNETPSSVPITTQETATSTSTPEPTPTPIPKETIEQAIQGNWIGTLENQDGKLEALYIFDTGRVTCQAKANGVLGETKKGNYTIEDGIIKLVYDNGVEGTLDYTYENSELALVMTGNIKLERTDLIELTTDIADVWKVLYYADEFGEPTSEGFVGTDPYISGKFSNSATTDSLLYAAILVDKDYVSISLLEYGQNDVKNAGSYDNAYDIKMRTTDGTTYDMTGTLFPGDDKIAVDDSYKDTVITALSGSGSVDFYIVESDSPTTTYSFTVESADFADEYQTLK